MNFIIDNDIMLRALELSDVEDIFNTIDQQRAYLGEWLAFVAKTKSTADTEVFVKSVIAKTNERKEYTFTIRKHNIFIGMIGIDPTDILKSQTEIGYWLSKDYQKQGIVTKAVQLLCNYAFNELDLNKIIIKCAVGNELSKKIPQRLGFKLEGIEKDTELDAENNFRSLEIYSKFNSD